jgi:hypothetical protein
LEEQKQIECEYHDEIMIGVEDIFEMLLDILFSLRTVIILSTFYNAEDQNVHSDISILEMSVSYFEGRT